VPTGWCPWTFATRRPSARRSAPASSGITSDFKTAAAYEARQLTKDQVVAELVVAIRKERALDAARR